MANKMYGSGMANLRPVDWPTLTLKVMLLNSSAAFAIGDDTVSDISALEVSGTGYTGGFAGAGRLALTNKTSTFVNPYWVLDADDLSWAGLNVGTIGAAAIWYPVTSDADSILIAYIDSGFPVATSGGAFPIQWSSDGVLRVRNA